ncbi:DUF4124 domain-containing protein [Wenzhouxiangella sediminis]|uniref:DUF4124 domain-containing protein n=2 Tax=Wenzhouxiangella sediminis TaxID=1792836 RepID=A0A3E1K7P7_9GAMM|nr:DUF4124 domain-containing protein [Wenzhouxiangella sediminis]
MTQRIAVLAVLLASTAGTETPAQQVYRCESSNGSIIFSDLPCRSDIGERETVDATPHQGHRAADSDGPAYTSRADSGGAAERRPASRDSGGGDALSRRERLSLERSRKRLLSGLKRRHIEASRRRELIRELRRVDEELGIGPGEVADMPFHNREIYEEYPIH